MRKIYITLFVLISIMASNLFADCKVLNFGEANRVSSKFFGSNEVFEVVDYQAYSSAKPRLYKDNKGEFQFKPFIEAYNEFFLYLRDTAIKMCETSEYSGISNVDIKFAVDEKTYYFTATLNYIKKKSK